MTSLEPQIDFAALSDDDIARIGLDAAFAAFEHDAAVGLLNSDSLAIVVGTLALGKWIELDRRYFGPDGVTFKENIDPVTGKLATAIYYEMDSIEANMDCSDEIPEGPQRWTGAVCHIAMVETKDGWMERTYVGAASGVQGHFDMATTYTALTRMGALWALKMQAIHGKKG